MRSVRRRPRAERDLRDVWRYTYERRGERQADSYLRVLARAIDRLHRKPTLGVDYGPISPGLRRYSVERHRIFFRIDENDVVIVRVLHEAQDSEWQLSDET